MADSIGTTDLRTIAENEVRQEQREENIEKVKRLLRDKAKAEKVVRNLEREIEDLLEELSS